MTEQIDTADLRAKLAAATPGPWHQGAHYIGAGGEPHDPEVQVGSLSFRNDAALIVAAVNALPALLDEIERLRAVTDEQVEAAAQVMFEPDGPGLGEYTWAEMVTEDPTRADIWRKDARAALEASRQAGGDRG